MVSSRAYMPFRLSLFYLVTKTNPNLENNTSPYIPFPKSQSPTATLKCKPPPPLHISCPSHLVGVMIWCIYVTVESMGTKTIQRLQLSRLFGSRGQSCSHIFIFSPSKLFFKFTSSYNLIFLYYILSLFF